jgi:hypothetical protein
MSGDFEPDTPVWIWQPEDSGTAVESDLLDAGRRNWPRVISYARRYEQDSSVAANILEAVLLATSRVKIARRKSGNPIRNLDTYVYVAFLRKFKRYLARQPKIQFVGSLQDVDTLSDIRSSKGPPAVEHDLLAKELLQHMSQRTRQTFFLRTNGYSWKETARFLKTTANSAQVLFNKEIGKLRSHIMKQKGSGMRPGEGGEIDE